MPFVRQFSLGLVALIAGAAAAQAADVSSPVVPQPAPYVPPAYEQPSFTWSGAYVGAFAGYGWGDVDADSGSVGTDGFNAGGYAGYNVQFNNWVVGAEADGTWSGMDGSDGPATASIDWMSTVRARAGYAFDNFLLYGTGGIAFAGAELSDGTVSDSNTHVGWTAGVGAEMAMTNNLIGRIEYQYADFGDKTYNLSSDVDADLSASTVRVGLGFKF
jgi:outer membrane immunogenic protein